MPRTGRTAVEPFETLVGTPTLSSVTGFGCAPDEDATEAAIMAWAIDGDFDGLWWREDYDPSALSAPRGCIFPSRLASWSASPAAPRDLDEDEALAGMPATRFAGADVPAP